MKTKLLETLQDMNCALLADKRIIIAFVTEILFVILFFLFYIGGTLSIRG